MALTENIANVVPDLYEVFFGATKAPFQVDLTLRIGYVKHDIRPSSKGETIARLVTERVAEVDINWYQCTAAELQGFLNTVSGDDHNALKQGDLLPQVAVRLHDPRDETSAGDIHISAATFGSIERAVDGKETAVLKTRVEGMRHSDGTFFRIGPPA